MQDCLPLRAPDQAPNACTTAVASPQAQLWATNATFFPARYYGLRDPSSGEMGALDALPPATWVAITIFGGCLPAWLRVGRCCVCMYRYAVTVTAGQGSSDE